MDQLKIKKQEIFNKLWKHALSMNEPSMYDDSCAYRGESGGKCLAGALIPDESYDDIIEGSTADEYPVYSRIPDLKGLNKIDRDAIIDSLIRPAQQAHDNSIAIRSSSATKINTALWKEYMINGLKEIASENSLNILE